MPDNPPVLLHHEVKLRDEIWVAPELVQHIMLRASGTIDVPEGFTGKVFDGTVIGRGFESDGHNEVVGLYKDRGLGGVWQICGFLRTRFRGASLFSLYLYKILNSV